MRGLGGLFLLTLLACAKPQPRAEPAPEPAAVVVAATPESPPVPSPPPDSAGETPPPEDPCGALRARFEAEKKEAPLTCATAADCKCYSSLQFDNTIEVADKASAVKLQGLSDGYRQLRCPTVSVSTARPPQCRPQCVAHRCK